MFNNSSIGGGVNSSRVREIVADEQSIDLASGYRGWTEVSFAAAADSAVLELLGAGPDVNEAAVHFKDLKPSNACDLYLEILDGNGQAIASYDGDFAQLGPWPDSLSSTATSSLLIARAIVGTDAVSGRAHITRGSIGFHVHVDVQSRENSSALSGYSAYDLPDVYGVRLYWTDSNTFVDGIAALTWRK